MASIQAAANSVIASIGAAATAARAFRNQKARLSLEERRTEIMEQREARKLYEAKTERKRANLAVKKYREGTAGESVEATLMKMGIDPDKTKWRYT